MTLEYLAKTIVGLAVAFPCDWILCKALGGKYISFDYKYRPTFLRYAALVALVLWTAYLIAVNDPDQPWKSGGYVGMVFIGLYLFAMFRDVEAQRK